MLDIPIQLVAAHDKLDDYDFLFLESLCRPCSAGAFCSLEPRRQWVGCEWFLSIKISHKKRFYVKATLAACHGNDSRRHAKKVQGVRFCASPGHRWSRNDNDTSQWETCETGINKSRQSPHPGTEHFQRILQWLVCRWVNWAVFKVLVDYRRLYRPTLLGMVPFGDDHSLIRISLNRCIGYLESRCRWISPIFSWPLPAGRIEWPLPTATRLATASTLLVVSSLLATKRSGNSWARDGPKNYMEPMKQQIMARIWLRYD